MIVIPAIDIKDGKCVRLFKGLKDTAKVYYHNPVDVALMFKDEGAERLHVVDLDGAFEGALKNLKVIEEIVKKSGLPVEVGGGIRDRETVSSLLDAGVSWAIVGTLIVEDFERFSGIVHEFPERIIAGIDAKKGKVAVRGWVETGGDSLFDVAERVDGLPVESIIFTEITRDGTLEGVERELTAKLAQSVNTPVIASGGVASLEDIKRIKELEPFGVIGVIVGKALYEKRFSLREAIEVARDAG